METLFYAYAHASSSSLISFSHVLTFYADRFHAGALLLRAFIPPTRVCGRITILFFWFFCYSPPRILLMTRVLYVDTDDVAMMMIVLLLIFDSAPLEHDTIYAVRSKYLYYTTYATCVPQIYDDRDVPVCGSRSSRSDRAR